MTGKIAVSAAVFAIDKPYSYRIPEEMTLLPGMRVQVPFGRGNKLCDGIVLSVEAGDEAGLKAVCCALDDAPVLTPTQLKLASFLRERYFCVMPTSSVYCAGERYVSKEDEIRAPALPMAPEIGLLPLSVLFI